MKEVFVIDSNILMLVNRFFGFETAPRFWSTIKDKIDEGSIIILDVVKKEINNGEDDLVTWINSIDRELILDHRMDSSILNCYSQILQEIANNKNYSQDATFKWFDNEDFADPWIIAVAMAKRYTIVSSETKKAGNSGNPTSNPKIPTVASLFNVETINLQEFLKRINLIWD